MGCNINLRQQGGGNQKVAVQDWRDAADSMRGPLTNAIAEDYDTQRPVFGAITLALSDVGDDSRAAFLALEPFRPGVLIPLPLVRLAVQEHTGTTFDNDAELRTTLLHAEQRGLLEFVQQHSCYKLLDLQAMFLDVYPDYPDHLKPSSCLFQTGEGSSASDTPRQLLAAFFITYGKNEVVQHAQQFLGLDFNAAGPELSSQVVKVSKLAAGLASGALQPMSVVAAVLKERAWVLIGAGKYQEGLQDLNRANHLDPNNAAILSSRGYTKRRLGQDEEALEDLDMADQLDPHDAMTLRTLGYVRRKLGQYPWALQDLDRADELQPDDAFTLRTRGDIKRTLGMYPGALQDLDRAHELKPDDAFTLRSRGEVKRILGQYPEALLDLEKADQLQPNNVLTQKRLAAVRCQLGQLESNYN